jgi:hypothetical protein
VKTQLSAPRIRLIVQAEKLAHECDDIVGSDQSQPATAELGQQIAMQLGAVEVERSLASLTRCDLHLEIGQPPLCHLREGEPRRDRQLADAGNTLKQLPLPPSFADRRRTQRAKAWLSVDHDADGVLSVAPLIDAARNTTTPIETTARCHRILLHFSDEPGKDSAARHRDEPVPAHGAYARQLERRISCAKCGFFVGCLRARAEPAVAARPLWQCR